MRLRKVTPLSSEYLEQLGFYWHTDEDESAYVADELVVMSEQEANAFYEAGNELYKMYIAAGEYVIEHELFHEVGIPFNLVELVKQTWQSDIHWHLYSRFDLAGGIEGMPIKLIEFNADTPTALFETAIVQWAILKQNGLDETRQFNAVYEMVVENFKRIVTLQKDTALFDSLYEGWRFLFSSIRDNIEEENTVRLLEHMAKEAGFETAFAYIDEVEFDANEGIFLNERLYELWFKLIGWEEIALHEPSLAKLLEGIVLNQKALIFNPTYALMFQSKGMLPILWKLFEGHPLLLESSFEPLKGKKQVQKPLFGREGESVRILDEEGRVIAGGKGEYDSYPSIYQEYTEFVKDDRGDHYQAGLFYAYESCGLGFRRGGKIIDNGSKFVGHIVE